MSQSADFITVEHDVVQDVTVWALPVKDWEREKYGDRTFYYKIYTEDNKPYEQGAVAVVAAPIRVKVPEGINLVVRAVATLKQQALDEKAEFDRDVEERNGRLQNKLKQIEERIASLSLLTYEPMADAIEGVLVEED